MRKELTVSVGGVVVAGLTLLAILGAFFLGAARPGEADESKAPPGKRTVAMTGTGEVTSVPDEATFSLSVTEKRPDVADALAASSATTRRVLGALRKEGVAGADVKTTGLSINPSYERDANGRRTITGYTATQRAQVAVRELADAGDVLAAAVKAGGNSVRVSGLSLVIGDPEALLKQARDKAVAAAQDKAEQYAAATGQSLGDVVSLKEAERSGFESYAQSARASLDMAAAGIPIRAGEEQVQVSVSVVWAFE